MSLNSPLPDYERPPVAEVVCGILFEPLKKLLVPHFGELWRKFQGDYPDCQEVPPLEQRIERFDERSEVNLIVGQMPPLPRIWFTHKKRKGIIQVQRDRFLHNWVKATDEEGYPRYPVVIEMFRKHLAVFEQFLASNNLGEISPRQYELTYVNHIPQGEVWKTLNDVGTVFPDFGWRSPKNRYLANPEGLNYRLGFALPEESGRLHVSLTNAKRRSDDLPILILDLTVRGMPKANSKDAMWQWFDVAHEWIVRGFEDLTDEQVQKNVWRKK